MRLKRNCGSALANVLRLFFNRQCLPIVKVDLGPVSVPCQILNRIQINFMAGFPDVDKPFQCCHV
jgi:hypothetical protein